MIRKESQQKKGLGLQEKTMNAQYLIKIAQYDQPFNFIHSLFGYTLGCISAPLNDRFIIDLKKKFTIIQELFYSQVLQKESIALIVIDAIESFKKSSNLQQNQENILTAIGYSTQQTMINPNYIYQKWQRQSKIQEQNRSNELAFKKFLEEQAQQNKMKAQQMQSQGWECQVCLTEIDRNKFGILQCSHIFHPQCIGAYLKTKIQASELDIKCPMQECGALLGVGDIYQFADPDLKQKFQKFTFNRFVQKNNASTAWCPTAGCPAVFQFDQQLTNYKCPACSKHYCLRCKCIYHEGMSCAQYRVNNSFDKNDQDFINYVKGAKYKQCPHCNFWVERTQGCSTMACKCGQEFCYDCGGTTCPHGMCNNSGGVRPAAVRPVPMPVRRPMMMPPPNKKPKRR